MTSLPSPGCRPEVVIRRRTQCATALAVAALAGLLSAAAADASPSSLASKQAQVERVLAQIQQLDASMERAVEAYNVANEKLGRIENELVVNRRHITIARRNLQRSQRVLADRLVTLYTSADAPSTLSLVLGATSLSDLLDRIETTDRVSEQDVHIRSQIVTFRNEVRQRHVRLTNARAAQKQLVAERAAHKASIEQQLRDREQLVASIRSEIERMKEAERRRQAELARQARARAAAAARASATPPPLSPAVTAVTPPQASTEASPPAPPPVAAAPARGGVVAIAMRYLGIPYKWGGASPSTGFDCSGFTMYVYAQVGVSLPHNAAAQYGMGTPVPRSQLQPGDLVFFNGLGHNGIYIGGGQFIHSPHTGDVVKISSMTGWYSSTYVGARRV